MNISHFQLTSLTFEVRYEPAYELYDDSGEIWASVRKKWGELKPLEAVPNSSRFVVKGEAELGILLDKAHVIWPGKKIDQKQFNEYASFVFDVTKKKLNVLKFSRVGMREIFIKRCKTAAA